MLGTGLLRRAGGAVQNMSRGLISVVTPCFNEEGNVEELYRQIKQVFAALPQYDYEHLYIDNSSQDATVDKLRRLAAQDQRVKVTLNARNFGHIRSPYHALLQANGDAAILMASDLQDPPTMLPEFLAKWQEGFKVSVAVKNESDEFFLMFWVRRLYYRLVTRLAEVE